MFKQHLVCYKGEGETTAFILLARPKNEMRLRLTQATLSFHQIIHSIKGNMYAIQYFKLHMGSNISHLKPNILSGFQKKKSHLIQRIITVRHALASKIEL
jgi:hypothetical protein